MKMVPMCGCKNIRSYDEGITRPAPIEPCLTLSVSAFKSVVILHPRVAISSKIYSIQKAVANIYKRLTYDNVEWDDQINFNKLRSGPTRPPR